MNEIEQHEISIFNIYDTKRCTSSSTFQMFAFFFYMTNALDEMVSEVDVVQEAKAAQEEKCEKEKSTSGSAGGTVE